MAEIYFKNANLERLLSNNPDTDKKLRTIIEKLVEQARREVGGEAAKLSDRDAYKAVHKAIYRRSLGANLNILRPRKRGAGRPIPPESPRKKSTARGGNRMPRSRRTVDMLSYQGADMSFILNFLNSGTIDREHKNTNHRTGAIRANNWFSRSAPRALNKVKEELKEQIAALVVKEFNKK